MWILEIEQFQPNCNSFAFNLHQFSEFQIWKISWTIALTTDLAVETGVKEDIVHLNS